MCTNCGNNNCKGSCSKSCTKIYKPSNFIGGQTGIQGDPGDPGVGIVNIIDNMNGTFTIFLSNGSNYIITMPAGVYNDWANFTAANIITHNFTTYPLADGGVVLTDTGFGLIPVCEIMYVPLSPFAALIRGHIEFKVTVDTADPEFVLGGFKLTIDLPQFPAGGVLPVAKVMDPKFPAVEWQILEQAPVYLDIQQQTPVVGNETNGPVGAISFDNDGAGNNRLKIKMIPEYNADGLWNTRLGFAASTVLIDA